MSLLLHMANRVARRMPDPFRKALRRFPLMHKLRSGSSSKPSGPNPTPGSLRPFVYLPTWERWSTMRQRPQEIVKAFADAGHPAYFVDPFVRIAFKDGNVNVVPTLASVPSQDVLIYIHFAPVHVMARKFTNAAIVYDILDDLSIFEPEEIGLPPERTVAFHHPDVMSAASVVVASAEELIERHAHERSDIILAENGVDLDRFSRNGAREILGDGPIVGYHGAVAHWFDFDLLETVARRHPDWSFPIIGPIRPDVRSRVDAITLPNVAFLGERSPDDIAAYIRGFHVGVVWFKVNYLTEGVSPLKVYEWLAAGVAPVSVPLPAVIDDPLIEIGYNADSISQAISNALRRINAQDWQAESAAAAELATWDERIRTTRERLDELGLLTVRTGNGPDRVP